MESLIFRTGSHIITGLMLIFSVYLLLRGHNSPGGGFIAGLISVIAFSLLMIAEGSDYVRKRLYVRPPFYAAIGILICLNETVHTFGSPREIRGFRCGRGRRPSNAPLPLMYLCILPASSGRLASGPAGPPLTCTLTVTCVTGDGGGCAGVPEAGRSRHPRRSSRLLL